MNDIESRLRTAMQDESAEVRAPSALAPEVTARGRQARTRRRVVAGATLLVVAALVVPVYRGLATAGHQDVPPSHPTNTAPRSTAPTKGDTPPAGSKTFAQWVSGLGHGVAPSAGYYSAQSFDTGTHTIAFLGPDPGRTSVLALGPVPGGLGETRDQPATFGVMDSSGTYRSLGKGSSWGMVGSPDGSEIAVGVDHGTTHEVAVYRAGVVVARVDSQPDADPTGWVGDTIYFSTGGLGGGPRQQAWSWSPGTTAAHHVAAVVDSHGVGLADASDGLCQRVVRYDASGAEHQSACFKALADQVAVVSPDGARVLILDAVAPLHSQLQLLDVATGRITDVGPRLSNLGPDTDGDGPVWESDASFLLASRVDRAGPSETDGIVRCTVSGACEVALEQTGSSGDFFAPPLYFTPARSA